MKQHRFAVLSDLHGGSIWGLWQPNYETMHGGIKHSVTANKVQLQLYKNFKKLESKLARRNIKTLFLNGDILDGPGYRNRKGELVSEDLNDQIGCMGEILHEFIKKVDPEVVYQLSGTDYHTTRQQDLERQLAKEIRAEYLGLGPYDFEFGDLKVNVAHGGGGVYWYRASKMDKILFALALCKADSVLYDADLVIRSHYHFGGYLEFPPNQFIMISPCFQAQTSYMRQRDPFKMVPVIGSLEVTVNDGVQGHRPFSHRFYTFEHPPRPIVEIAGFSVHRDEEKKTRKIERW